ncbi:hypothetical protein [Streptomyces tauricus]
MGSAAEFQVELSRVATREDLAACLNMVRNDRGLKYEAMEASSRHLKTKAGGVGELLAKSTVGDIVKGKQLPTEEKLRIFLAVCAVSPADVPLWLAAWRRARVGIGEEPHGAVRVRDARPRELGVHAAITAEDADSELPTYVPRDIDPRLRTVLQDHLETGGFVVLVGNSFAGKTRTLYESIMDAVPSWWLVHPPTRDLEALRSLASRSLQCTVIWLDELQRYLDRDDGLDKDTVQQLLRSGALLVSTMWPDDYEVRSLPNEFGEPDRRSRSREVLDIAEVFDIDDTFSPQEVEQAVALGRSDSRIRAALSSTDTGLTQTLAAGPDLVRRWEHAKDPYGAAVISAAVDARRLGVHTPVTRELLREAAPGYLTTKQRARADKEPNSFDRALCYATEELRGAAAAVSPMADETGSTCGYMAADYLLHRSRQTRRTALIPASAWLALTRCVNNLDDRRRLARAADRRLRYQYAIPLYASIVRERRYLDVGIRLVDLLTAASATDQAIAVLQMYAENPGASWARSRLAKLLAARRDVGALAERAAAGDDTANRALCSILFERADLGRLQAKAEAGDEVAEHMAIRLMIDSGQSEAAERMLETRANSGDTSAMHQLMERYRDRSDDYGVKRMIYKLADAGDPWLVGFPAAELARSGDLVALRERAESGDDHAWYELSHQLSAREDLDGLREVAQMGQCPSAPRLMAELLAKKGQVGELRERANTGDHDAQCRLARILADTGLDELRERAECGEPAAVEVLTDLLLERGETAEAIRLLSIIADADPPAYWARDKVTELLVKRKDLDGLARRAVAGDWSASEELASFHAARAEFPSAVEALLQNEDASDPLVPTIARLLVKVDDHEGAWLVLQTERDPEYGQDNLIDVLAKRGYLGILRAIADWTRHEPADHLLQEIMDHAGLEGPFRRHLRVSATAAYRLATELARQGDDAALEARATWDEDASRELSNLMAARRDLDRLRSRADADDRYAADALTRHLAKQGAVDLLLQEVQAGTEHAGERLAELWERGLPGDRDRAADMRAFGLDTAGSVLRGLDSEAINH